MEQDFYAYLKDYLDNNFINQLKESMNSTKPAKGFVLNTNKISIEEFKTKYSYFEQDKTIPYLFRYDQDKYPLGKSLLHELGVIYILDPAGVIISTLIDNSYQRFVLDMCAAPGGKTISYAISHPNDLIIANDYSPSRSQELAKNIERLGLGNVVVTSYPPSYFKDIYPNMFDVIILDAPCSGNGMFRKEEKMELDWSIEKVNKLLPIQDDLLNTASCLLKEGGNLIYSTCSFLKMEDEDRLIKFLNDHKDFEMEEFKMEDSYYKGEINGSIHLFPNKYKGEGHFISLLKKQGHITPSTFNYKNSTYNKKYNLYEFEYKNNQYGLKVFTSSLLKLNSNKIGVKISDNSKFAKINLDHNLARYLDSSSSIQLDEQETINYIKGEELITKDKSKDGICILSYDNFNIGFANKKGTKLKNCYPKGLRKNLIKL